MARRDHDNSTRKASRSNSPERHAPWAAKSTAQTIWIEGPWGTALAALVIAGITFAVYYNSLSAAFVMDDHVWIQNNPNIRQLWPLWPVLAPSRPEDFGGRPVISLTLAINYALGGTKVWGYHVVNLAIHILAALTLFGLVRRTLRLPVLERRLASVATPLALAVAVVWAVHPLQTQAVTYAIQRTESLVGLFYLLTMYCVVRGGVASGEWRVERDGVRGQGSGDRDETGVVRRGVAAAPILTPHASSLKPLWYLAAVASCALGMATKEVMVTAPLVVLLYDRTFLAGSFRKALAARWGLYLALAATWGILVWVLVGTGFHGNTTGFQIQEFDCWSYLCTQSGVILHYLRLAIWPTGQCLDYGWPAAGTASEIIAPGLVIVALLGLTGWALVKRPALGFLGASFFLILAPTSSFMPIRDAAFEHRMYLSLAAVVTLVFVGAWTLWIRLLPRLAEHVSNLTVLRWAAPLALLTAVALALGWATVRRNDDYRSDEAILADALQKYPNNARILAGLAGYMLQDGKVAEAIPYLQKALEIDPDSLRAIINLAHARVLQEKFDLAIPLYERWIELDPDSPEAYLNLGQTLTRQGKTDQAITQYERFLKIKPDDARTRDILALALYQQGKTESAIAEWHRAIASDPKYAKARNNLATAFIKQGKTEQAITEWRQAIEFSPEYIDSYTNLGIALQSVGRVSQAIDFWHAGLKIDPACVRIRTNLGLALYNQGLTQDAAAHWREAIGSANPNDAVYLFETAQLLATNPRRSASDARAAFALAQRAVQLTGSHDPKLLALLALTYAETNRFAEAIQIDEKALQLATERKDDATVNSLREAIKQYQARMQRAGRSSPDP